MPTRRLSSTSLASEPRRRRSSHLLHPTPTVRPGIYGFQNRQIAFAPNVTPGTYVEPDDYLSGAFPAPATILFPPSEKPAHPPTRKRLPPGKRPSQGYIPRPPNAFMLFRADFVKQRHVPGSIETNHGSLSKIIGNCWRQLPLDEKRYWEQRAKEEKQRHKIRHPDYRFRPVHNKNKKDALKPAANGVIIGKKDKPMQTQEEEFRCDAVAALLLEGKKGDELARAVRDLDNARNAQRDVTSQYPDSALAMPHVPFRTSSRPVSPSPVTGISFAAQQSHYHDRLLLRRPSSAQPIGMTGRRSWSMPMYDGYTTMPFLQDLGISNPYSQLQSGQHEDAETAAGELDYALFNGFSFTQTNDAAACHPSGSSQDGPMSTGLNPIGPHDLPPIAMDHLAWTAREVDSALDSATTVASCPSTTTGSSHESSPAPSDSMLDIFASTAGPTDNGMFTRPEIFGSLNGNYDMDLFDLSLNIPIGAAAHASYHSSTIPYFDDPNFHGMMDGAGLDPILHAPKPLLPNERTPTKAIFGDDDLGLENYAATSQRALTL